MITPMASLKNWKHISAYWISFLIDYVNGIVCFVAQNCCFCFVKKTSNIVRACNYQEK